MKPSENFKKVIQTFLESKTKQDLVLTQRYNSPSKNLDECVNYILQKVKESGCNGFTDNEVFGMALHYYDEDKLDPITELKDTRVIVNHVVELSEEDKQVAHQIAMNKAVDKHYGKITSQPQAKDKKVAVQAEQASLF